ncbi:hypothetical protein EV360DRAFT_70495 [Lentinula raphanica]|nr:hypothetical protein EV360DRAFT_70495 [Lentinula raphanica]
MKIFFLMMQKGDLSKVTLNDKTLRSRIPLDFMKCLRHGMRVANLLLFSSEILGTLNLGTVSGLETIHVGMDRDSISLFWTVLLSTPSNIKEVWFFDKKGLHDVGYTPPFMESFIEESKRQGLDESFNITAVGLGRATGHSHQWDIVNLSFRSTTSLLSTLALAASLFPKLEVLTLNLFEHEGTYDIADFVLVVAHFSFLKTVYLLDVLWRLEFKSRTKSYTQESIITSLLSSTDRGPKYRFARVDYRPIMRQGANEDFTEKSYWLAMSALMLMLFGMTITSAA